LTGAVDDGVRVLREEVLDQVGPVGGEFLPTVVEHVGNTGGGDVDEPLNVLVVVNGLTGGS
jgi:hypothetical protein